MYQTKLIIKGQFDQIRKVIREENNKFGLWDVEINWQKRIDEKVAANFLREYWALRF